jgi:hypothetical protein
MNVKRIHRAYFEHFIAAKIFIEATEQAGYYTDSTPMRNADGSFKGWLVTWFQ